MRFSYKRPYEEATAEKIKLEEKVSKLAEETTLLNQEIEIQKGTFAEQLAEKETALELERSNRKFQEAEANEKILTLEASLSQKQEQLNKMEIKKMAAAYATQETEYASEVTKWAYNVFLALASLVLAFSWSISAAQGKIWYERFEFYLVDIICISAVWFSTSQYTYHLKLRNDYANRKTIAQTYHNLLLSIEESEDPAEDEINKETKRLFMSKATEVLCARSIPESKEPVLSKKLLKDVAELSKILK